MPIADRDDIDSLSAPQRLDAESRADFRRDVLEFLELMAERGASRVVIDLRRTTMIDGTGLGVLVLLEKRARRRSMRVTLRAVPSGVREMLELTRIAPLFSYED